MMIQDIYVVHYKPATERRAYLEKVLKGMNLMFVDQYERSTVDQSLVNQWYKKDKDAWEHRVKSVYKYPPAYRDLNGAEICNFLSNIYILDDIIQKKLPIAMILEDDVIINDTFFTEFDAYLNETPKDFNLVFFGSSFTIPELEKQVILPTQPIKITAGKRVYEKVDHPKTRTVDATLITLEGAKKIRSVIDEMCMPYDFDLAYFIKQTDAKVYWWEPGLVHQGSQTGEYTSSIRNSGIRAKVRKAIKSLVRGIQSFGRAK